MSRLPTVTARELVGALERAGFQQKHQRGSHLHLFQPVSQKWTTVPMHTGDVKRPLLKAILKQAGLSEDQFRELL